MQFVLVCRAQASALSECCAVSQHVRWQSHWSPRAATVLRRASAAAQKLVCLQTLNFQLRLEWRASASRSSQASESLQ
jgi:hypothetical protein